MVESALGAAQNTYWYGQGDLFEIAAAYAFHIAESQAFVDGNKRTALYVAVTFMEVNGIVLRFDDLEAARELEKVAERTDSLEAATDRCDAWLRTQEPEGT